MVSGFGPIHPHTRDEEVRDRLLDDICICNSRFDRWAVLGGSGAASSGHFRPIWGGPGGVRAGIIVWFLIASKRQPRVPNPFAHAEETCREAPQRTTFTRPSNDTTLFT